MIVDSVSVASAIFDSSMADMLNVGESWISPEEVSPSRARASNNCLQTLMMYLD